MFKKKNQKRKEEKSRRKKNSNLKNVKEYGDKIEFKKEKNKLYILSNIYRLKELFAKSKGRKINIK